MTTIGLATALGIALLGLLYVHQWRYRQGEEDGFWAGYADASQLASSWTYENEYEDGYNAALAAHEDDRHEMADVLRDLRFLIRNNNYGPYGTQLNSHQAEHALKLIDNQLDALNVAPATHGIDDRGLSGTDPGPDPANIYPVLDKEKLYTADNLEAHWEEVNDQVLDQLAVEEARAMAADRTFVGVGATNEAGDDLRGD